MGPDPNYQVFNEDIEIKLKELGDLLGDNLPPGWGFTLFLYDFSPNPDNSLFYISNGKETDILVMLKKFIELKMR